MSLNLGNRSHDRRTARARPFAEINITPMVDVMLVLLVIFMVTAPMMTSGVPVELPKTKAPAIGGQDEPLIINLTADGKILIHKTPVALKDLQTKLKAVTAEKKDTRIFVRAYKGLNYEQVMQVVGEIAGAGFTRLGFLSEPAEK